MADLLVKFFGLFLVGEAIESIKAFNGQPAIFQLGRLIRAGIGSWLVIKG